jgi:GNAT superfamily N-acetyltransferase
VTLNPVLSDHQNRPFNGLIRPLGLSDLSDIATILSAWIHSSDEVIEDLDEMQASIASPDVLFLVASEQETVLGVVGLQPPSRKMLTFVQTAQPAELVHFYVLTAARRRGVGHALIEAMVSTARARGVTEIIFNSGPRYRDSAWDFYDHLTNFSRRGLIQDLYGSDRHAPVWGSRL